MLMRFHFGLGVGHVYSHCRQTVLQRDGSAAQSVSTPHAREIDDDNGSLGDEEEAAQDDEDDEDEHPLVYPTEQWYGSSQESLIEQYEEMYASELELDYEN